jgi:cell division protein FtsI (penicillin-binding protein 3)
MKVRIGLLATAVLAASVAVLHRAWQLQIVQGPELRAEAEEQQLRDVHLAPKRGTIYDRHGAELAVSVDVESVYANPRLMRREHVDVEAAAMRLSSLLGVDRERILNRLTSDRYFVWIERQVTPEEAAAVRALEIEGVEITHEARRFYPNGDLAAHVLGFANVDGVGIEGVELSMEDRLAGTTASIPATVDRRGRVVFSEQLLDDRATQGDDVYLTIDKTIQHLAERELALTIRTFEAQTGSVVVMEPSTGEVLAMANYPTYDPNQPSASPVPHRRNRAVTDRFEPGSTMKTFTVATALAAGSIRPDEQIRCRGDADERGGLQVNEYVIHEEHQITCTFLTPAAILAHSSNIGAAYIGFATGRSGLYRGLRRFGFGVPTGIELPGETGGTLRHYQRWSDMDLATISFGQAMSATTLQLATAMAAIANGGRLVEPTIVRRIVDARGEVALEATPRVRRQAVPRGTAQIVADMLTGVTGDEGTGMEAAIDGYLVAGKTGTAQIADYVHGGYDQQAHTASFVGFVPADAPRLVIAVVVDRPTISHYGGIVAGPAFRRIGAASLRHLGIPASGGGEVLREIEERVQERARQDRVAEAEAGTVVLDAPIVVDARVPGEGEAHVPDLFGASARRAMIAASEAGFALQLEGTGVVVAQAPAAGTLAPRGSPVRAVMEAPTWHEPAIAPVEDEPADPSSRATAWHGSPGAESAAGAIAIVADPHEGSPR